MHELFSKGLYNRQNMIEGMVIPNRIVLIAPLYTSHVKEMYVPGDVPGDDYVHGIRTNSDAIPNGDKVRMDGAHTAFINNIGSVVKTLLMVGVKKIDIISNAEGAYLMDTRGYRDSSSQLARYAQMRPNSVISVFDLNKNIPEMDGVPTVLVDAAMYSVKEELLRANQNFVSLYNSNTGLFDRANYLLNMTSGYVLQISENGMQEAISLMYSNIDGETGFTETMVARFVEKELTDNINVKLNSEEKTDIITVSSAGGSLGGAHFDANLLSREYGVPYPFSTNVFSCSARNTSVTYLDGGMVSFPREVMSSRAKAATASRNHQSYLSFDLNNLIQLSTLLLCHILVYQSKFPSTGLQQSVAYNCGEFLKHVKNTIFTRMFTEKDLIVSEKGKFSFEEKLNKLRINSDMISKSARRKFKSEEMTIYHAAKIPASLVQTVGQLWHVENTAEQGIMRYSTNYPLKFGNLIKERNYEESRKSSMAIIGLGGIGWNFADHIGVLQDRSVQTVIKHIYHSEENYDRAVAGTVNPFDIKYAYEYDELEIHNGSRLPVEAGLLTRKGIKKTTAFSECKVVGDGKSNGINFRGDKVNEELIANHSFDTLDCEDATNICFKYVVDCRDNIISEHIIPHTVFKASYDGGEYFSFFTLPKATAHLSFDINPEATAYQVIPSYYVTPAIISVCAAHLLSYDVIRDLVEKALAYNSENHAEDKYLSDLKRHSIDQEFCITDVIRQCAYNI